MIELWTLSVCTGMVQKVWSLQATTQRFDGPRRSVVREHPLVGQVRRCRLRKCIGSLRMAATCVELRTKKTSQESRKTRRLESKVLRVRLLWWTDGGRGCHLRCCTAFVGGKA